jgi:hypothetical protein
MNAGDGIQIGVGVVLTLTLLAVCWYAWEARKQAAASVETAHEMRQQRLAGVQPVVVISVHSATRSRIAGTLVNVGSGPSFDLSFCLQSVDGGRDVDQGGEIQVLRPGDAQPVEFEPRDVFEERRDSFTEQNVRVFSLGGYRFVAGYRDLYGNMLSAIRPLELMELSTDRGAELRVDLGQIQFIGYDVQPGGERAS